MDDKKLRKQLVNMLDAVAIFILGVIAITCYFIREHVKTMSLVGQLKWLYGHGDQFVMVNVLAVFVVLFGLSYSYFSMRERLLPKHALDGVGMFVLLGILSVIVLLCNVSDSYQKMGQTENALSYIVSAKNIHSERSLTYHYLFNPAVPKAKFVNKEVVISKMGYEKVDDGKYVVNGKAYQVNPSNVVTKTVFNKSKSQIRVTTYSWKKDVPNYIKYAYDKSFGGLKQVTKIEISRQ